MLIHPILPRRQGLGSNPTLLTCELGLLHHHIFFSWPLVSSALKWDLETEYTDLLRLTKNRWQASCLKKKKKWWYDRRCCWNSMMVLGGYCEDGHGTMTGWGKEVEKEKESRGERKGKWEGGREGERKASTKWFRGWMSRNTGVWRQFIDI